MAGFPDRPARADLGPSLSNVRPVTQPEKELDADKVDLAFWQTAGAGRVLPVALFVYAGATPALTLQRLAWDSEGTLANVSTTKNATGDYTFTFAASYENEDGGSISFQPKAAVAFAQGAAAQVQAVPTINGQAVNVVVKTGADAAVDATFLLLVW